MSFSRIILSESALLHNINTIAGIAGNKKIIFPVKANAYGHGIAEIVSMSHKYIDLFMTATLEEAISVKKYAPSAHVFIDLPLIDGEELRCAIQEGFIINIANSYQLDLLDKMPSDLLRKTKVQVEFDTGMNRTGFKYHDVDKVNSFFTKHPELHVIGVFTHYATGIEDPHSLKEQYKLFKKIIDKLAFSYDIVHSENSAGLLTFNFNDMSYIRPGITLYGLKPSDRYNISLLPVLSWKSVVIDVKKLRRGEGVSYGFTFRAPCDMKIATIPVGYGDGYPRGLSGKGYVLIRGKRVKIIGTVCMNHIMVDVSDIGEVKVGEEVILIGRDNAESVTADDLAALSDTINYEITTRISPYIPRFIEK